MPVESGFECNQVDNREANQQQSTPTACATGIRQRRCSGADVSVPRTADRIPILSPPCSVLGARSSQGARVMG
jgi:hypothetical protein